MKLQAHPQKPKKPVPQLGDPPGAQEELPYCIELWRAGTDAVERVLARGFSAQLAHAIFNAATHEHPERRITLRKGGRIVVDTSA